jgi:hypothetical protein
MTTELLRTGGRIPKEEEWETATIVRIDSSHGFIYCEPDGTIVGWELHDGIWERHLPDLMSITSHYIFPPAAREWGSIGILNVTAVMKDGSVELPEEGYEHHNDEFVQCLISGAMDDEFAQCFPWWKERTK